MKIGPGLEAQLAAALVVDRRAGHVRRHQVRRELHAREAQAGDGRERPRHQRLGEARVVLDQHVAVGQQPEQHELEHVALADHRALDLVEDPGGALAELGMVARRRGHNASSASSISSSVAGRDAGAVAIRAAAGGRDARAPTPRARAGAAPRRRPGPAAGRAGPGAPRRSRPARAAGACARPGRSTPDHSDDALEPHELGRPEVGLHRAAATRARTPAPPAGRRTARTARQTAAPMPPATINATSATTLTEPEPPSKPQDHNRDPGAETWPIGAVSE